MVLQSKSKMSEPVLQIQAKQLHHLSQSVELQRLEGHLCCIVPRTSLIWKHFAKIVCFERLETEVFVETCK